MALVLKGLLEIDCDNLSCLTFTDTTGDYSISNPEGYGAPNPTIADIISVDFSITDSDSNVFTFANAQYRPVEGGSRPLCLEAENFLDGADELVLVGGASYTLTYTVNYSGSDYTVTKEFVFPCCGDAITSNLATNYSITQLIGCGGFIFTDTTGTYNATTNTGGYGTPNPAYADIDSTELIITLEDGSIITIDSFIPTANVPDITIQAADLGYSRSNVPDQIITVEYSVYVAGLCRVGYKKTQVLLYCNTQTCINNQIRTVVVEGECTCSGNNCDEVQKVYDMQMLLDGLKTTSLYNMACIEGKIQSLYQRCAGSCTSCS